MNIVYSLYILLFILIIFSSIGYVFKSEIEQFYHPIQRKTHLIFDHRGYAYHTTQQPSGYGVYGCTQIPCPGNTLQNSPTTGKISELSNLNDNPNIICWNCRRYH